MQTQLYIIQIIPILSQSADRLYLVVATIMATFVVPGKVAPLEKNDLKSSTEKNYTDCEIYFEFMEKFIISFDYFRIIQTK